jgi:hypothetical protein
LCPENVGNGRRRYDVSIFCFFLGAVYVQDQDRVIAWQFSNAVSIQGRKGRLFDEFAKKLFPFDIPSQGASIIVYD